ncbi:MAG: helicase C-terminal domain-containing protein, partial [Spirochaetia bacterium]
MNASDRIPADFRSDMRNKIEETGGNEVLFIAETDEDGNIETINTAARGNSYSVPALMPHMKRGNVVIHNHPGGKLEPSIADLRVASELGNLGIGFFIVDNQVEILYAVAEPVPPKSLEQINIADLEEIIGEGGPFSNLVPWYEPRESQAGMLRMVARCLNHGKIGAAEAGTGVGKSMAYLLPVIDWVGKNEERTVITTATINLQQQLVEKDIPLALQLTRSKVKAVLVKGRGNYLCLNRLSEVVEEGTLFPEENEEINAILEWSKDSPTGSRSDLSFLPKNEIWDQVRSEADGCSGFRCRFRDQCFVMRARREAASANILVVNHHLLFSDLAIRAGGMGFDSTAVLPPFHRIIFDEAHNVEDSATSYFSQSLSKPALLRLLGILFRTRRGRNTGLLLRLQNLFSGDEEKTDLFQKVPGLIDGLRIQADSLEDSCSHLLAREGVYRLTDAETDEIKSCLLFPLEELKIKLSSLVRFITNLLDVLPDDLEDEYPVPEVRMTARRIGTLISVCDNFIEHRDHPESVFWLERRRSRMGDFIRFVITPLDIRDMMTETVYTPYESVVFASATLTVNGSFNYWKGRVGLGNADIISEIFPSPFPYRERVLLGVPSDAPAPDSEIYQDFLNSLIKEILLISRGRGLILFTSYRMLNAAFSAVNEQLENEGIPVLKQGDDERSRLLDRFVKEKASVLFATHSFWEGIDVKGDDLGCV